MSIDNELNREELTEIVVLKHAESVDRIFGNNWIDFYDKYGRRMDEKFPRKVLKLNELGMPVLLPKRFEGTENWIFDPPLSEISVMKSEEIGKHMKRLNFDKKLLGRYVYCSPCLCCVQTADCILRGLDAPEVKVRIEPALSNWKHQHELYPPVWRGSSNYTFSTIANVDFAYRPVVAASQWKSLETIEEFMNRLTGLTGLLQMRHRGRVGMLISHGSAISVLGNYLNLNDLKLLSTSKIIRQFKLVPPLTSLTLRREMTGWITQLYPLKCSPLLMQTTGSHRSAI
ncbi:His Phos 1 domain containing protein [Trichuris trichiura]|uniref:His Phos 1 domain containing protein n=1 Tax=Trichuris trichiura TaxID=36087 RepID=A0A077Z7Q3_TRITR|nr:His Phos 1 domain containing protein [Trichuris trichiura]